MTKEIVDKLSILRKVIGPHCEITIRFKGNQPIIVGAVDRKIALEEVDGDQAVDNWKDLDHIVPGYVG